MEKKKRGISRRGILTLAWLGGSLMALVQFLGISFAFLWPKGERKRTVKVALAGIGDIPVGGAVALRDKGVIITHPETGILPLAELANTADQRKVIRNHRLTHDVVDHLPQKSRESGLVVLSNICTHLGCKVNWNPETRRIECPCHVGVYNLQGEVVGGPPPRPLDRLVFIVEGGEVFIEREEGVKA